MARTKEQTRRNDALQSGAGGDLARGQDASEFGQGGQTIERPLESGKDDRPDRNPERDEAFRDTNTQAGARDE